MSQNKVSLAVVESDSVVVSMIRASQALAEAVTISQTKKIMDVAAAAEIYAKRQHLSEEAEQLAATVKVEALRKLGEMLKAAPKSTGAKGVGKSAVPKENRTLADLGLTKKESAVAQKLASLPEQAFQQVRDGHVTVAKAIAAVDATRPAPKAAPKPAPVVAPLADDSRLDDIRAANQELLAENEQLGARLAVVAMDATPEEREAAADLIQDLQDQVQTLERDLRTVKASRDGLMVENAELKKQVLHWRKRAEKAAA